MSLERVMNARSVAVIGASKDETKRGFQAIKTLQEEKFEGKIYPISLRETKILGLPCYRNINDVEDDVDLALITTPAKTIADVLTDCGQKGVAGAVIIAGGFREQDFDGRMMEEQIEKIAEKYNIRLIGPNTSGMINVHSCLNLVGLKGVPKGNIALITQSGNIALHLITEARLKSQKGFSYYVGVGNETDIKFHEYLSFLENDENTRAILLYVEGLKEGRKFLQQAYRTTRKKPVILLKSGRSVTGKRAAGSHTGALAGMSEVARTALKRSGIIYIENSDELFPVAETLSSLPPIKNNKVAILTDGGGHATIASDLMADYGVEVPILREKTQALLREILPKNAAVQNPIDVAGGTDADPEIFAACAKILLNDGQVGGLLIAGLFGGYGLRFVEKLTFIEEDAAHQMGKLVRKTRKPIILQSLYNFARPHSLDLLRYYDIPVYDSLDISCRCVAALSHYGSYLTSYHKKTSFILNWRAKAKKEGEAVIRKALLEGRDWLLENEAKKLLQFHGVPVTSDRIASTADEAVAIYREIGDEVVLKIVSPDILHKSDAGGVRLKLNSEEEVRNAFNEIIDNVRRFDENAEIKGCLVSRMMAEGMEIIIGTKVDDQFGPVIMFGIGGIMVEILKDVSFRVLPLSRSSAAKMIKEIKSAPILDGIRGKPEVDKKAIVNLLVTVSEIIEAYPQIREMDLNPVIVHEEGVDIVDARVML